MTAGIRLPLFEHDHESPPVFLPGNMQSRYDLLPYHYGLLFRKPFA